MPIQRTIFLLTAASVLFTLFAGNPNVAGLAAGISAIGCAAVAWWVSEKQQLEKLRLLEKVAVLERRTTVEHGSSAAIYGQGELATYNYSSLVSRLRADGNID